MEISDLSRDGVLKISFDQEMLIPDFLKRDQKTIRRLTEVTELDATQYFQCKIAVKSDEKKSDLEYFYKISKWNERSIELSFEFEQPLAVSKGFEKDHIQLTITKSAKRYFVSSENFLSVDFDY